MAPPRPCRPTGHWQRRRRQRRCCALDGAAPGANRTCSRGAGGAGAGVVVGNSAFIGNGAFVKYTRTPSTVGMYARKQAARTRNTAGRAEAWWAGAFDPQPRALVCAQARASTATAASGGCVGRSQHKLFDRHHTCRGERSAHLRSVLRRRIGLSFSLCEDRLRPPPPPPPRSVDGRRRCLAFLPWRFRTIA